MTWEQANTQRGSKTIVGRQITSRTPSEEKAVQEIFDYFEDKPGAVGAPSVFPFAKRPVLRSMVRILLDLDGYLFPLFLSWVYNLAQ